MKKSGQKIVNEKKKQSWCSHWNCPVAEAHGELFTVRRPNGDWGLVGGWLLSPRTSAPDSFGASWPNNRTMDKYLSPNHRLWFPDGLMLGSIGRVMMLPSAKWSRGPLFFCLSLQLFQLVFIPDIISIKCPELPFSQRWWEGLHLSPIILIEEFHNKISNSSGQEKKPK